MFLLIHMHVWLLSTQMALRLEHVETLALRSILKEKSFIGVSFQQSSKVSKFQLKKLKVLEFFPQCFHFFSALHISNILS